jgi:hypothetical protein
VRLKSVSDDDDRHGQVRSPYLVSQVAVTLVLEGGLDVRHAH